MSTTTISTSHTATSDPAARTVQFSQPSTPSRRNSAGINVTSGIPKAPAQLPPTPTTAAVSTPPTSRPSTPSTLTATPSSPPPSPTKSTVKPVAKSKWLNHLSHISIATWIGVGLALGGLVVTIYYGIPIMRLAVWTAQNDFREACKSELEAGLQQSAACNRTLAQPAQPPPIMKRTISSVEDQDIGKELAPWVTATCFAFLLALCSGLSGLTTQQGEVMKPDETAVESVTQPNLPERSVSTANTSQDTSAIRSLTLEELMDAVIERSKSNPEAIISLLKIYLARETFGSEPDSAVVRGCIEASINWVASRCPLIKIGPHACNYREDGESEPPKSESIAMKPSEDSPSHNPPTQNAEPPTTHDTETEANEKPAQNVPALTPAVAASSTITAMKTDSNTGDGTSLSVTRADPSTKSWKAIPSAMTTAIARSIALASPRPKFMIRVNAKKLREHLLVYAEQHLRGLPSQGLYYLLALVFGGCATPLLWLVPNDGAVILIQITINLMCYFAAVSLPEREVAHETSDLCVNRLLLFSVYTCMCRIWPIDNLGHDNLILATVTGLCAWTLAVPCVVHGTDNGRSWESSSLVLRRSSHFGRCILLVAPLPFVHLALVALFQRLNFVS